MRRRCRGGDLSHPAREDSVVNPVTAATIEVVKAAARSEIMPRYLNTSHAQKSDGSPCSDADIAAQEYLARELCRVVDCPLLGEEMAPDAQRRVLADAREYWCVDPIDGTSNFVNGIPYFCVSVALMRGGRPQLGVVYDPSSDEVFHAEAGAGAYLNGDALPIRRTAPQNLRRAIAEVDLKRLPQRLAVAIGREPPFASQRNFGASALDWCYVAAGRFDVYAHGSQQLWDYAAGALVLAEAGGHMCTLDADDFWSGDPLRRSVVCALHAHIFNEWRDWLRTHI